MREIKFRVWDGKSLFEEEFGPFSEYTLSDGVLVKKAGDYNNGEGWTEPTKDILEQYTGLKDKNGVEIYEGDIYTDIEGDTEVVTYSQGTWSYSYRLLEFGDNPSKEYEVIGNIHENKELLK